MKYLNKIMLSKKEVKHIAKLARIKISEEETASFQKELSSILDYVDKLDEVETEGVKPLTHTLEEVLFKKGGVTQIRKDKLESQNERTKEKLLKEAPDKKDGFLKIKSVFKNRQ